jgi:hypothetical protein
MANFNKPICKRRADTASVEHSMQQLGLLPVATLTANGEWVVPVGNLIRLASEAESRNVSIL